jgi:type IV secretory pathway VirD2 relaxase
MTADDLEDITLHAFAKQLAEIDETVTERNLREVLRLVGGTVDRGRIDALEFTARCVAALVEEARRRKAAWDKAHLHPELLAKLEVNDG